MSIYSEYIQNQIPTGFQNSPAIDPSTGKPYTTPTPTAYTQPSTKEEFYGGSVFPTAPANLTGIIGGGTAYDPWALSGQKSPAQTAIDKGVNPGLLGAYLHLGTPSYTGGVGTQSQNEDWLKANQNVPGLTPTQNQQWNAMFMGSQVFNPGGRNNQLIAQNPVGGGGVTDTPPAYNALRKPINSGLGQSGTVKYEYNPSNLNAGAAGAPTAGNGSSVGINTDLGAQNPTGTNSGGVWSARLNRNLTPYEIASGVQP